jgi:hypothetical protein
MGFFAQPRFFFAAFAQTLIVALLLVGGSARALADDVPPIADPDSVAKQTMSLLASGQGDAAATAITQDISGSGPKSPKMIENEKNLKNGFKIITQNGKADSFEKLQQQDLGSSVKIIVYYLNYPRGSGDAVNEFVFTRYTFMKIVGGWAMTDFTFTTSSVYPPVGWPPLSGSK